MGGLPLTTWICAKMARHNSALCKSGTRAKIALTTWPRAKMARQNGFPLSFFQEEAMGRGREDERRRLEGGLRVRRW